MAFDLSLAGKPSAPSAMTYASKDVVLYALGIGAKKDELDYLYEGRGPKVFPSFAVVPTFDPMFKVLSSCGGDLAMVVHGGQKCIIAKPLAPEGTLSTVATLRGYYDLRKFAVVLIDTETHDAKDELVFRTTWNIVFRGAGGFGGKPPERDAIPSVPKDRPADFCIEERTSPEQALLYRLNGDPNPLHADPEFAARVGFPQGPILHGLCTYGYMVRHAVKGSCGGDATRLRSFGATFKRPVWPGDTLVTRGWNVDGGALALEMRVKERDEVVIGGAWALAD